MNGRIIKSRITTRRSGMTFPEVMVTVMILAVLFVIFLPVATRRHGCVLKINCTDNLKQIGLGFRQWALDHDGGYPGQVSVTNDGVMELIAEGYVSPHFLVLSNELNTPKVLFCPEDRKRTIATTFNTNVTDANISYFVGVDATETNPATILVGDAHLTIDGVPVKSGLVSFWTNRAIGWTAARHEKQGNLALADGSVQQYNATKLQQALKNTGVATNRLALP